MFTKIFIDRPKLSLVISLAISLLGALCIFRLPIAEYPEVAPPCIYVLAQYPGASSQVMADTVASIIEEECNGIEDMIYFNSTSENSGSYYLTLYFEPGRLMYRMRFSERRPSFQLKLTRLALRSRSVQRIWSVCMFLHATIPRNIPIWTWRTMCALTSRIGLRVFLA